MDTPVVIDTYSRLYGGGIDLRKLVGVPTAFQCIFGNPMSGGRTVFARSSETFDHEVIVGNQKRAVLIPRGINGTLQSNKGTVAAKSRFVSRIFPLSEIEGEITADQLNKRLPMEDPYQPYSRSRRLQILAKDLHVDHTQKTIRLFESLAKQSFLTGKQDAILGTAKAAEQYDFYRKVALMANASAVWDTGSPDILGEIDDRCDLVKREGFMAPSVAFTDGETLQAMIKDAEIQKLADNRRFLDIVQMGGISNLPAEVNRYVANGWVPMGKMITPRGYNLVILVNNDGFINEQDAYEKYMPRGTFAVMAPSARYDRWFGPAVVNEGARRERFYQEEFGIAPRAIVEGTTVRDVGDVLMADMFYHDAYPGESEKSYKLRTQSAPIFAPVHSNTVGVINNVLTPL